MIGLVDFATLPPEINTSRMYAGVGAGTLVTAAAAWAALAAELNSTAISYQAVLSTLTEGPWVGPSSSSMAAAAFPYVSWMTATAAQARKTAGQLAAAVAAYETAFAATVPPVSIEVNRALLASLVATNIFGQNTEAIAAAEAHYAEMWARDAAAMYGYAEASAAATVLMPFGAPPQITNPSGTTAQRSAVAHAAASAAGSSAQEALSNVPELLHSLSSGAFYESNWLLDLLNSYPVQTFNSLNELTLGYQLLSEGVNFVASGAIFTLTPALSLAASPVASALSAPAPDADGSALREGALDAGVGSIGDAAPSVGAGGPGTSASMGDAVSVGRLSVPPSSSTSPTVRLANSASPIVGFDGIPQAMDVGLGASSGMPPIGPVVSAVNAPRGDRTRIRTGPRHRVIPALGVEPRGHEDPAARWARPNTNATDDASASERDELNQLRKAFADVSRQRDVLKRTAATLIEEATHK